MYLQNVEPWDVQQFGAPLSSKQVVADVGMGNTQATKAWGFLVGWCLAISRPLIVAPGTRIGDFCRRFYLDEWGERQGLQNPKPAGGAK